MLNLMILIHSHWLWPPSATMSSTMVSTTDTMSLPSLPSVRCTEKSMCKRTFTPLRPSSCWTFLNMISWAVSSLEKTFNWLKKESFNQFCSLIWPPWNNWEKNFKIILISSISPLIKTESYWSIPPPQRQLRSVSS